MPNRIKIGTRVRRLPEFRPGSWEQETYLANVPPDNVFIVTDVQTIDKTERIKLSGMGCTNYVATRFQIIGCIVE
jgi:hypothetical protein